MPNEFVIRNGFISKGNSIVEGGITATTISASTYSNLPSPSITVGTSQLTSGTDTRVLFQSGTTLQQDGNFTFDPTLKRLTLQSVGSTSSDIPFVIRSSGGTFNIVDVVGTGDINFRTSNVGATGIINMSKDGNGAPTMYLGSTGYKWHNFYTSYIYSPLDGNNGYEGRIDLGRYNGTVRTRFVCAGDSFLQYSNLVLGATTAGARLDVRAQGALSTDIAFRVRNSADTYNIFSVQGDSKAIFLAGVNNATTSNTFSVFGDNINTVVEVGGWDTSGSRKRGFRASSSNTGNYVGNFIDYGNITGGASGSGHLEYLGTARMNFANFSNNTTGWAFMHSTNTSSIAVGNTVFAIYPTNAQAGGGTLALGTTLGTTISSLPAASYGKNTFFIASGTAPTTTGADAFGLYSADITAGNAAPHFRTENGAIVKVYQETTGVTASTLVSNGGTTLTDTDTFDGYTLQQVVKALRNLGILQ